MDINLFSKCLKRSVLESDCVSVQGLGVFFAQLEGASFSDKGATLSPPYRKLSFRSEEQGDEKPFTSFLAAMLPEGCEVEAELAALVEKIRDTLFAKRSVNLEGLGTLRSNPQQMIFFVADEGLDIYPEGFGLRPVAMKIHTAAAPQGIVQAVSESPDVTQPEVAEKLEEVPGSAVCNPAKAETLAQETDPIPQDAEATAQDAEKAAKLPTSRKKHVFLKIILALLALCAIIVAAVVIFRDAPWMDALLDRILYTKEEQQLILMFGR